MDHALGVGDWVQASGRTGRILEIRWRSTLLRTLDGDMVLVPNSKLLGDDVLNHSRPSANHRCSVRVGLHYRHAPNDVRAALTGAAADVPNVLATPAPDCYPVEFGESAIVYVVRFWVDDYTKADVTAGEVRARIWYAAQRAGLELPFPIRTVQLQHDDAEKRATATRTERKQRLDVLADVPLFASLDRADREVLADGMRRVRFGRGEIILEQGDDGTSLYVIVAGTVRVSLAHGAVSRVLATLGSGECFGEMSLLTGAPRAATCVAETDVECFELGHEALRRMLVASPHLAEELTAQLASRQTHLSAEGAQLSAEAQRQSGQETPLLARVRTFFGIG
jgi:CRP-like cAMP-binding protein